MTQKEAANWVAEGKGASEVSNDDFPPEVVQYLSEGIEFAVNSPLPEAEEGGMWVYREDN